MTYQVELAKTKVIVSWDWVLSILNDEDLTMVYNWEQLTQISPDDPIPVTKEARQGGDKDEQGNEATQTTHILRITAEITEFNQKQLGLLKRITYNEDLKAQMTAQIEKTIKLKYLRIK